MLEENGVQPAIITGKEHNILQSKTKRPPICYMCGKERHATKDHAWAPARYVLLTGRQDLQPIDIAKISQYINRRDNMYGRLVKVILGSSVAGEGIDFKRIRQIHIMEPWYNRAKILQVEGRAIRNGSHIDLPPEQRNVDIFKYCMLPPKKTKGKIAQTETIDERNYRFGEDKDRKIKFVERLLKEVAVDCLFQRDNNVRKIRRVVKLEDSLGKIVNYVTGDKPCSPECDYMRNCEYECSWCPKKKLVSLDRSTYGPEFAQADVERARERIQQLFGKNFVVDVTTIFDYIQKTEPDVDSVYTYLALESLMDQEGDFAVQDRYGREGYLIERGDLFIYQPFDIYDSYAPIYYRQEPLTTKPLDAPFPVSEIADASEELLSAKRLPEKPGQKVFEDVYKKRKVVGNVVGVYLKGADGEKKFSSEITSMVLDKLPDQWAVSLLRMLLNPGYEPFDDKDMDKFVQQALAHYTLNGNILIQKIKSEERRAVQIGAICSQWGRAEHGIKKKLRKAWGKCDPDVEAYLEGEIQKKEYDSLWAKVPTAKRARIGEVISRGDYIHLIKQLGLVPEYAGTVEGTDRFSRRKDFKLLDFTRESSVTRKDKGRSKRSEIRGRTCTTFSIPVLRTILGKIEKLVRSAKIPGIKFPDAEKKKISKENMCRRIEFLLRVMSKSSDKIWFYQGQFSLDE
jgi:hypothetical protein